MKGGGLVCLALPPTFLSPDLCCSGVAALCLSCRYRSSGVGLFCPYSERNPPAVALVTSTAPPKLTALCTVSPPPPRGELVRRGEGETGRLLATANCYTPGRETLSERVGSR